ncbi:hypothetical protein niasHS_003663 [Heterodera schachtii]|uniref:Uncharacterized protein n=1 Tax=Heterodera schachtii TaxID=97005 RepID=A0ABD2KH61_HETSC
MQSIGHQIEFFLFDSKMGTNYSSSNSAPFDYGMTSRKKRKNRTYESNHFDKNYLIEGTEFWAENEYRKDSYLFERRKGSDRANFAEIYGKTPAEYGSPRVSCRAFSCSPCASSKESAVAIPSHSLPPSSAPWSSPIQPNGAKSAHGSRPVGVRSKYLPTFG